MGQGLFAPGDRESSSKEITRRQFLTRAWWAVAGLTAVEAGAGLVASLWPKAKAGAFGSKVSVVSVDQAKAMPVGTVTYFNEQRFYLSRFDSGFLALYRRCTHLGCVVPWRDNERSEDDLAASGRFNCPCHGSIYDRRGVVRGGPAPRPLDLFPLTVEGGKLVVDTGRVIRRSTFEESQVTKI